MTDNTTKITIALTHAVRGALDRLIDEGTVPARRSEAAAILLEDSLIALGMLEPRSEPATDRGEAERP